MKTNYYLFTALLLICSFYFNSLAMAQDSKTPMMGWSSWNTFRININETLIKGTADAMVEKGLKEAGYTFVNVDDGFFAGRDTDGNLINNDVKFPKGMKDIADYIHSKGLKAGIYSEAGKNTCGFTHDDDKVNGLNVGFYGYEERDAERYFNTWGYDFIKVDYCGASTQGLVEKTQYMKILDAISKIEGEDCPEPVRFNVCRWMFPGTWITEVDDRPVSWRISHDIRNNFNETLGIRDVFEHNLYLSAYASPGHFNDMDMMQIGRNTFTEEQEKSHFGLWCIMKSPLMIGCDLRSIPASTLKIITNKEVIALNQDKLGLQAQVINRDGRKFVMSVMIEEDQGKVRGVALFNGTSSASKMRINFKDIQLSDVAQVRDLWQQKDLGSFTDYYETTVPAYGTAMLRIEGESSFDQIEFEGENAFIKEYDGVAIDKNKYTGASFSPKFGASGEYTLKGIGGSNKPNNWAEFRRVYSTEGGKYKFKLFYYSGENRNLTVSINGQEYQMTNLNSGGKNKRARAFIDEVELQQGYNTIRFSNATDLAPEIDKFILLDPSDSGDDNEPDVEIDDTIVINKNFPTISSEDDSNEIWYYIQFRNQYGVFHDMGDGIPIQTKQKVKNNDAQLWKVVKSGSNYSIVNKGGRKINFSSGRFQTSSSASVKLNIVQTTNTTYSGAWEIQRAGQTNSMNQFGGAGLNVEIGEWSKGDPGNSLLFIPENESLTYLPEISTDDNEEWYYIQFKIGNGVLQDMGDNKNLLTKGITTDDAQHWKVIKTGNTSPFVYQIVNKSGRSIAHVVSSETSDGIYQASSLSGAYFDLVLSENATYPTALEIHREGSSRYMNQYKGAGIDRLISEWNKGDGGNCLSFVAVDDAEIIRSEMPEISKSSKEIWYYISFVDVSSGKTAYLEDMGDKEALLTNEKVADKGTQLWKVIESETPEGIYKYNIVSTSGNFIDWSGETTRYIANSSNKTNIKFNELAPYWILERQGGENGKGMSQTKVGPGANLEDYWNSEGYGRLAFIKYDGIVSTPEIEKNTAQLKIKGRQLVIEGENVKQVNVYAITGQLLKSVTQSFTFPEAGYYLVSIVYKDNSSSNRKVIIK